MGRESGLEYGSSMSGSGSTLSGSDSALSGSAAADFAGTAGSESGIGRDWQARSSFDAGPEGR